MSDPRHKDNEWVVDSDTQPMTWHQIITAVLMDLRDECKSGNLMLASCHATLTAMNATLVAINTVLIDSNTKLASILAELQKTK